MGFLKKSFNFNKKVFGGGYLRDIFGGGGGSNREGQVSGLYAQALQQSAQGNAQAIAQNRRALGDIKTGYGNARKNALSGKSNAMTNATNLGKQSFANSQQSLTNRNLGSTTILENARAGNTAAVTQATSNIDAMYAQLLSELDVGEAGATANARGRIGSAYQSLGQNQAGILSSQAQTMASLPAEDENAWLDSLLSLGGTALGFGISGGFGSLGGGGQQQQHPPIYNPTNPFGFPG